MHSSYDCDIASDLVWMKKIKEKESRPTVKRTIENFKTLNLKI
jgi:hypothetical protein